MIRQIRLDDREILRSLARWRRAYPRIVSRVMNRATKSAMTAANRYIRANLRKLSARAVRDQMRTLNARPDHLVSEIIASARPIPLREYAPRKRRRGLTIEVIPGERNIVDRGFIWRGHVFHRVGRARLPIRQLYGPSIATAVDREDTRRVMTARFLEVFSPEVERQVQRALSR